MRGISIALIRYLLCAICCIGLAGCNSTEKNESASLGKSNLDGSKPSPIAANPIEIQKAALAPKSPSTSETMFSQLDSNATGIDFQNTLLAKNMRNYLLNGAGVCAGDYDNDGLVDFYAVSQDGPNKLFRQVSNWKFEDVTESAGNVDGGDYWGTGASFADVNNDGLLDLYVCNQNGPNLLYVNNGDATFHEDGKRYGVDFPGASMMAAFADFDNDGDLDLYLVNDRLFKFGDDDLDLKVIESNGEMKPHPDFADQFYFLNGKIQEAGQRDVLLRNDEEKFTDVTVQSGIAGFDMGLSATWWDYDHDGQVDLYVGNDFKSPDHLYRNLGNGKFQDVLPEAVGHSAWFSMGADSADLNNDGMLDFVSADMSSTTHYKQKTTMGEMGNSAWFLTMGHPRQFMRNSCFINSGTYRFWEAANLTGLDSTDWTWSVKLNDYDCDGRVDAFFTNGIAKNVNDSDLQREYERLKKEVSREEADRFFFQEMPPLEERNLFFRNAGDLQFENVSSRWGADDLNVSHGCTVADFDRDGDLDMIVNRMNKPLGVYCNDTPDGNRVLIRLVGTQSNRFGIGARVTAQIGSETLTRELTLARGYMSADEPMVHFGLGPSSAIDKMTVQWPSGIVQEFSNLDAGNLYTITEKGTPQRNNQPDNPNPMFSEVAQSVGLNHKHTELEFDDYRFQPLLPNKLSQLGPGIAWADVNGDGRFDCYVGGAIGQTGKLFVQSDGGQFNATPGPWGKTLLVEEMGAVFLDFDSDGDQDLYVVSGGYEKEAGDETLRDSLYVNDGSGSFTEADEGILPDIAQSGSCACACDFDRDGDLDLFVGTRMIPHQWPLPTDSYLLVNNDGKFEVASGDIAAALSNIGLVTSGLWSDVDGDGWTDLLVTLEWGPVRYLKNENGRLVDQTQSAGLDKDSGWWNSITGGDVDNDGDVDYVVMNTGLNTKYHANYEHPVTLYANDFDNNGQFDLVESEWEGDKCFPIRGKSCSSHAMPVLSEKFPTYHEFAMADLSEIYGSDSLENSKKFIANDLRSVLLINDGSGRFEPRELPRLAQISPGFGVAMEDLDGDGNCDIFIAQNFMNPQPETGQMDGGMGLLLLGRGDGSFDPVGPRESGIIVPEQGMGVAVVDLNADQVPDIAQTVNDGPMRAFQNRSKSGSFRRIAIRLDGGAGNPTGVGSRVRLKSADTSSRVAEVYAGSGYLSQSSGELFFAMDQNHPPTEAEIRLPNGQTITRQLGTSDTKIVINLTQELGKSDP